VALISSFQGASIRGGGNLPITSCHNNVVLPENQMDLTSTLHPPPPSANSHTFIPYVARLFPDFACSVRSAYCRYILGLLGTKGVVSEYLLRNCFGTPSGLWFHFFMGTIKPSLTSFEQQGQKHSARSKAGEWLMTWALGMRLKAQ